MKNWHRVVAVMFLTAMIFGCGEKLTEEQMRAKALDYENKGQWEDAVNVYEKLLKSFPKSEKADETLYKLGVIYANNLQKFDKSVECYQKLIKEYPTSNYVIQSSFMIGYRYANDIKDLDKARQAYTDFLKKYPTHELASSVQWELDHLGEDISSIELQLGADSSNVAKK